MERIELVDPNPRKTGQSFETLAKVQEQMTPVIDFASRIKNIPNSNLTVGSGRVITFYNPHTRGSKTFDIPDIIKDPENNQITVQNTDDGKYVVAYREYGPALVFNGVSGDSYDFNIAPNEVGPRVMKRFESESTSEEQLVEKMDRYRGIRSIDFSSRGRFAIVRFRNSTSRVFDLKEGTYITPAINTYQSPLTFDYTEDNIKFGEDILSTKNQSSIVELTYDLDTPKTSHFGDELVIIPSMETLTRRDIKVFDKENREWVVLEGVREGRSLHQRYVLANVGDTPGMLNTRFIYDLKTKTKIDLSSFDDFIGDLTMSEDGKYAYYTTTLNGQPPTSQMYRDRDWDTKVFKLKAINLQTREPIPLPMIPLFTHRTGVTVLPVKDKPEVVVIQASGEVIQLNVDKFVEDPLVMEYLSNSGDVSTEIARIGKLLETRSVSRTSVTDRDLWAQFLTGQSGLTPEMLEEAIKLQEIELEDGGNAVSSTALVSLVNLSQPRHFFPKMDLSTRIAVSELSSSVVSEDSEKLGKIPFLVKSDIQQLFQQAEKVEVFGRTVVVTKDGKSTAIKLQRDGESLRPLIQEATQMTLLQSLKSQVGLLSDLPQPRFNHDQPLRRIRFDFIPEEIRNQLGEIISVRSGNNTAVGMAYEVPEGYFTYYHQLSDEAANDSTRRVMHDLFSLARVGYIHPDIIELFHNQIQLGRSDGGKYIWNIDSVRPMLGRFGAGRLHAWKRTVDYPNFGPSGIRDFAELGRFSDIYTPSLENEHISHLSSNLLRLPNRVREKVVLQYFLGNYMLAWTLAEGRRLSDAQSLTKSNIPDISKRVQSAFEMAYTSFTNEELDQAFAGNFPVNWDRFARQMVTFMTSEYTNKTIDPDVYGIPASVTEGDGWGFIDRGLLTEELLARGVKDIDSVINAHFEVPRSGRRRIPSNILRVKSSNPQPTMEQLLMHNILGDPIKKEPRLPISRRPKAVRDVYKLYGVGMRANGRDEDLGPMNGPLPLTELITANYLMTTAAITKLS